MVVEKSASSVLLLPVGAVWIQKKLMENEDYDLKPLPGALELCCPLQAAVSLCHGEHLVTRFLFSENLFLCPCLQDSVRTTVSLSPNGAS